MKSLLKGLNKSIMSYPTKLDELEVVWSQEFAILRQLCFLLWKVSVYFELAWIRFAKSTYSEAKVHVQSPNDVNVTYPNHKRLIVTCNQEFFSKNKTETMFRNIVNNFKIYDELGQVLEIKFRQNFFSRATSPVKAVILLRWKILFSLQVGLHDIFLRSPNPHLKNEMVGLAVPSITISVGM